MWRPVRTVAVLGALLGLAALSLPLAIADPPWSAPVDLSTANGNLLGGRVTAAASGPIALVGWSQLVSGSTVLQVARSADSGTTWQEPVDVSPSGGTTIHPQVAIDGSLGFAVWAYESGGSSRIQVATTNDGGANWSAPLTLSADGQDAFYPSVSVSGGQAVVAWQRSDGVDTRIQSSASVDGGATWSSPVTVSGGGVGATNAKVVLVGDSAVLAWYQAYDQVYVANSANAGGAWSTPVRLSGAGVSTNGPAVAMSGSNSYVAWNSTAPAWQAQVASSSDGGVTWSAPTDLSPAGPTADQVAVAATGGGAFVTWSSNDGTDIRVQVARSVDSGASWSAAADISTPAASASTSSVAAAGTMAAAVWITDDVVQSSIALDGQTWSSPVNVSATGVSAGTPVLVLVSGGLVAAWSRGGLPNPLYAQASARELPTTASPSAPRSTFVFLLPDGRECSSISPASVVNGSSVRLPEADALCRTPGSHILGWRIPGSDVPFPPGKAVTVVDSQRFTVVLEEPTVRVLVDANVGLGDSCLLGGANQTGDDRVESLYLDRPGMEASAPGERPSLDAFPMPRQAPCTPPGYALAGWNTQGDGRGRSVAMGVPIPTGVIPPEESTLRLYADWVRVMS